MPPCVSPASGEGGDGCDELGIGGLSSTFVDAIPTFSGEFADFPVYRMRVNSMWRIVNRKHLRVFTDELIARLGEDFQRACKMVQWQRFHRKDGLKQFWQVFLKHYTWGVDTIFQQSVVGYIRSEQQLSEDLLTYLRRFKQQEFAFVEGVNERLRHEATVVFKEQMRRYIKERRRSRLELDEWYAAAISQRTDGMGDLPSVAGSLVRPVWPIRPGAPEPGNFRWPQILSGCLLMMQLGLSPECQAALVEAAGGSLRDADVARTLLCGSTSAQAEVYEVCEEEAEVAPVMDDESQYTASEEETEKTQEAAGEYVTLDARGSALLAAAMNTRLPCDAVALVAHIADARIAPGALRASLAQGVASGVDL